MTTSKIVKLFLICCTIFLIIDTVIITAHAFGGNDLDEFQPNPFLSPEERERAVKKQQKLEANRLIQDPPPAKPQNGPSADYKFDHQLSLTVGDMIPVNEKVRTTLDELVRTAYFRYYKVNLHSECPYWAMNRMCTSGGGCNVCECTENEIPKPWRIESTDPVAPTSEKDVLPGFHNGGKQQLLKDWVTEVWSDAENEQRDNTATYVNLLENIEGNTGYSGEEPRRIWDAIYNENCFARIGHNNVSNMCFEDRLMYRLISGLHSSISAHVFKIWKLDEDNWKNKHNQFLWNMLFTAKEHNITPEALEILENALPGTPESIDYLKMIENDKRVLERLNNLFFTLEMLLESIATLHETDIFPYSSELSQDQIDKSIIINTGDRDQDIYTANLLNTLIQTAYDRSKLYTPETTQALESALVPPPTMHTTFATLDEAHIENMRHLFHNVSVIMNCVGCEKCRIWSKLNILGISTGLRLAASHSMKNTQIMVNKMQRNEIIALVNTLNSFSEAVHLVSTLSKITPAQLKAKVKAALDTPSTTTTTPTTEKTPQQPQKERAKLPPKPASDMSQNQKLILILITMITLGIVGWRYSVSTADTFGSIERMKQRDPNQPRNIPALQLDRMKRQEQDLSNAKLSLGAKIHKQQLKEDTSTAMASASSGSTSPQVKKNRKLD